MNHWSFEYGWLMKFLKRHFHKRLQPLFVLFKVNSGYLRNEDLMCNNHIPFSEKWTFDASTDVLIGSLQFFLQRVGHIISLASIPVYTFRSGNSADSCDGHTDSIRFTGRGPKSSWQLRLVINVNDFELRLNFLASSCCYLQWKNYIDKLWFNLYQPLVQSCAWKRYFDLGLIIIPTKYTFPTLVLTTV